MHRFWIVWLILLASASVRAADTLAWWRFEDVPPGQWLVAEMGSPRRAFTTTQDIAGHTRGLRTFNTDPTRYPPDTSPEFQPDVGPSTVDGGKPNARSAHFTGKQYLYTVDPNTDAPLYGGEPKPFTVEGLFKLEKLPDDYDGRPQTVLCKAATPVSDPIQLAIETAPPVTTRPNGPTSRPTTDRSATTPATTRSTTTRAATTRTTLPAFEGSTERVNDHPVQPMVCYVQGTSAWPEPAGAPVNDFVVVLTDKNNRRHVLHSDQPLVASRWYAFAVTFDGQRAALWLTGPGDDDYRQQADTRLPGGLYPCRGNWMLGCGLLDDVRENWWQGWIDEVRISAGTIDPDHLLAAYSHAAEGPPQTSHGSGPPAASIIHGLADPEVLRDDDGVYYCYGTRDQINFPVYSSTDLLHWDRGPDVLHRRRDDWAKNRYWAPSPIKYRGKYYLFYSALGHIEASGDRWSHRVNVAVSDSPLGPFELRAGPLPLIGKAVIDPSAFVDADGHVYLYFVADMSENEISQIFVAKMNDDLTAPAAEPVLCIQPTQVWEGKFWNEGPHVFRAENGTYVMTYSAQFWHSPEYGVGFATSRSPTGPWTKNPANPILQRWRGLFGSGGDCVVPMPDGKDMAIVFHADGPPDTKRRDTYVDRLVVTPDPRLGVMLKPEAWSPAEGK